MFTETTPLLGLLILDVVLGLIAGAVYYERAIAHERSHKTWWFASGFIAAVVSGLILPSVLIYMIMTSAEENHIGIVRWWSISVATCIIVMIVAALIGLPLISNGLVNTVCLSVVLLIARTIDAEEKLNVWMCDQCQRVGTAGATVCHGCGSLRSVKG